MTIIIGLDRDGTINKDKNSFLGSSPNWKKQIKFLPGVIKGIKDLNKIEDLEIFILTNQSGVALKGPQFDLLDEKRMNEVNQYILDLLRKKGAKIRGYFSCPYIDRNYLEKAIKKGREVNPDYIKENHPDLKPNIGMIQKAIEGLDKKMNECKIYYIGDRLSDVQTGLNANGTGILIISPKTKELGDEKKVKELQKTYKKVYIANDFLDAVNYIKSDLIS